MKNIHVLPTDKPSRLYYNKLDKTYQLCEFHKYHTDIKSTHNIYITSDEEIKDCWVLNTQTNEIYFLEGYYGIQPITKKIILTTDSDLINNGVQSIDDKFLEWFVKNPTCEKVDVKDDIKYFNIDELRDRSLKRLSHIYSEKNGYKIIIPKEEPKQETLEEASKLSFSYEYGGDDSITTDRKRDAFIDGAKWQQERSYSEEEVYNILVEHTIELFNRDPKTLDEWFEQIKKK